MSFGVAVLATAVGGVPEIIQGGNGMLVPANDPDALAGKMIELLSDARHADEMGAAGLEHVRDNFLSTRELEDWLRMFGDIAA